MVVARRSSCDPSFEILRFDEVAFDLRATNKKFSRRFEISREIEANRPKDSLVRSPGSRHTDFDLPTAMTTLP